jgi:hypothetical protein
MCVVTALVAGLVAGVGAQAGMAQAASATSSNPVLQMASAPTMIAAAGVSSSVNDADAAPAAAAVATVPVTPPAKNSKKQHVRPFSRIAIGTKSGTLGLGGQIATPLASWLTLRGGADFFSFGLTEGIDGATYGGNVSLKSGIACVDIFPFGHGLHISPGIQIFHSTIGATMNVPGGNTFSMGDSSYTSDPNDPVTGNGSIVFSRSIMPSLTVGFGNIITRKDRSHWSVPFEVGAAYTAHYTMQLNLAGSVCSQGFCQSVGASSVQQSVTQEQSDLNEAAKHYQLYPIISSGIAYRF